MSRAAAAAQRAIEAALGRPVARLQALGGGCIAQVYRVDLTDGERFVAKCDDSGTLALEARMLEDLRRLTVLPLPQVVVAQQRLLIMTYIAGSDGIDAAAEAHAATLLASLHGLSAAAYGYDYDTVIAALPQPNPWHDDWVAFFRDQRLWPMARRAAAAGHLSADLQRALERLCDHLARWLDPPQRPALVHGDIWAGNVLVRGGRVVGLLDPAIYYADAEVELAFIALFNTFGDDFFRRYEAQRPLRPGFRDRRCPLYQLYPLLVHAALFGQPYPAAIERIVRRFAG